MVSIDRVYQKVLALANKEQRGYITPQEFNLFATQAQMEIFEQYFYDINQFKRIHNNNSEYHNMIDLINEKLHYFKQTRVIWNGFNIGSVPIYKLGDIYIRPTGFDPTSSDPFNGSIVVEEINAVDVNETQISPLTKATESRPIYYIENNSIFFYPQNISGEHRLNYIKKPIEPTWGYVVVKSKALYNANTSTDFELHVSEESELVYRVLAYAGIAIEKPGLTQMAVGLETSKVQQEKI